LPDFFNLASLANTPTNKNNPDKGCTSITSDAIGGNCENP